jgi:hypothetical protein
MLQGCGGREERKNLADFWKERLKWESLLVSIPTPSPSTFKSRDWRGVYKKCLQNLEPQGVKGQNLENTVVNSAFSSSFGLGHGDAERHHAKIPIAGARSDVTRFAI